MPSPTGPDHAIEPAASSAPASPVLALAAAMRDGGGNGMELVGRALGGQRLRLWMPSRASVIPLRRICEGQSWKVLVHEHYDRAGATHGNGVQVVVDVGTQQLGLPPGPVA